MQMSPRPRLQPWASQLCRGWSQSSAHDRPLPTSVLSVCFPPDYRHLNGPGMRQAIWPSAQAPLGKTQLPAPAYPLLGPNPRCLLPTSHAKSGPTLAGLGVGGLPLPAAGVSNTEAHPHSTPPLGGWGDQFSRLPQPQGTHGGGAGRCLHPEGRAVLRGQARPEPASGPLNRQCHPGVLPTLGPSQGAAGQVCPARGEVLLTPPHPPVWRVHCLSVPWGPGAALGTKPGPAPRPAMPVTPL